MAIQLDYTDQFGEQFPTSYWVADVVHVFRIQKKATITVVGFKDQANRFKRVIGRVTYTLNGAKFDEYFSPFLGEVSLYHQLYLIVTTELVDGVLFFEGASEV